MALTPGTELASYKVLGSLGAGAMGEVYRARDTRLDRDVAIKVLPQEFAQDHERLLRFEREAKSLASLNHPNVAQIHGVDQVGTTYFLVLELVEGETLEDRLKRGALHVDEALDICRQIAGGLEAAHEAGVIHRDLKPANVRITPQGAVKVLDFGVAKSMRAAAETKSSTDSVLTTEQGRLLGTPTYMAPEQARGKAIDRRVDIWAFGCVLYECLTGRRAFRGDSLGDVLAAVIEREVDLTKLPPTTPPRVRELLAQCFEKDARNRLRDIGDARLALEFAGRHGEDEVVATAAGRTKRESAAWILAAAGLLAAAWLWSARTRAPVAARSEVVCFQVPAPPGTQIDPEGVNCAVSPDGRKLAFLAGESGRAKRIWIRDQASLATRPLAGTEGAQTPFWSPTSDSVAFFAGGRLARVSINGEAVQTLAEAPVPRGGDWSENGTILFAPFSSGALYSVPQSGGAASAVTALDAERKQLGHRFPQFLPGGRKFLYAALPAEPGTEQTFLGSLDSPDAKLLLIAQSRATFAPPDWLLFDRDGLVYAQRLDLASDAVIGAAVPTGIDIGHFSNYGGHFVATASRTGVVAAPVDNARKGRLVRLDRSGQIVQKYETAPDNFSCIKLSPDGNRAIVLADVSALRSQLRIVDLTRGGVWNSLTTDAFVYAPVWSPDGEWIYYSSDREFRDLYRCKASGGGQPELLLEAGNMFTSTTDIAPDAKSLIYEQLDARNGRDLWLLDLSTKHAQPLMNGPASEFDARFSPDGKWIAYATDESGRPELYVEDFPDVHTRTRVSTDGIVTFGSATPSLTLIHWAKDGSELIYLAADHRTLMSVAVSSGPPIQIGASRKLFELPPDSTYADVARDGQSLLVIVPDEGQAPCSIAVTLNWTAGLAAK